jgi:chemotaxis protein MotD
MQVGEQIVRKLERGGVSFEMRLDPPELGQVQIKLEVSGDGGVKAHVGAETPAALAELVRNARELERALTASGLRLEDQGLTFDLNDRPQGRDQPDRDRGGGRQDRREGEEIAVPPVRARSLTAARIDVLA